ncbi:DUF11 domain-containing protein [Pseudanabaena sp. FACHB-1277]|uniref:DUF11 domain-containing protein n=1 Tax=Pseudanabaena cinerea FACHB-1277 TaxID=2949581 RepID=A0A926USP3_9CYAN|nr:DUF11 domain-containing protein [Pseudanabaena cinerea]MBD2150374.1 DUF11 domain-containing protein [Pseudanabaena cinerea FACHB-1277]
MAKKWQNAIMAIRQLFNYLFNYFAQVNLRQLKRILLPFAGFIITLSLILFANHHTAPPAQSQVTVASINKSFLPIAIDPGGVSRLSISIFNSSASPLTGNSITDVFPAGMTVAAPLNIGNSCGGTVTAVVGGNSMALNGGTVPPASGGVDGSCTISVDVTSTIQGNSINNIPINALTNDQVQRNATQANATLQVRTMTAPSINKVIAPSTIATGDTALLTITLRNNDLSIPLTNASFTDTLPANVLIAGTPNLGGTCLTANGGTGSASTTPTSVTLTGATVAPNSTCTLSVSITSNVIGNYTNDIPAGAISSTQGVTNANPTSAPLAVQQARIVVTKSFNPSNPNIGENSNLTITLTNSTTNNTITGINLTDTMPADLTVVNFGTTTCTSDGTPTNSTLSFTSNSVTITGGILPPNSTANNSCTITATVTSNIGGLKVNTIDANNVANTQNLPSTATSANINFRGITGTKTFARAVAAVAPLTATDLLPGEVGIYTLTLTNPTPLSITNIAFTDTFPNTNLQLNSPPNVTNSCNGTVTANNRANPSPDQIILTSGSLVPNSSCTITFEVVAESVGSMSNSIPANTITNNQNAGNANNINTAAVRVPGLRISKVFSPSTTTVNGLTRATITVENITSTTNITNILVPDVLPSGLIVATPPNDSTTCTGGSVRRVDNTTALSGGETQFRLVGASLNASSTCTFQVDLTPTTAGNKDNVFNPANITNAENAPAIASGATLTIDTSSITVNKSFLTSPVNVNSNTRIRVDIIVPAGSGNVTGLNLTDTLPAGLQIASTPNLTRENCAFTPIGAFTATAGGNTITLTGVNINQNQTCRVEVNAVPTTPGNKVNEIPASAITTNQGRTNTNPTSATLQVTAVQLNKSFSPNLIAPSGRSVLSVTITNYASFPLTNVQVIDPLPQSPVAQTISIANPPNGSTTCASGTVNAIAGGTSFSLTGATVPAFVGGVPGICTFQVEVTGTGASGSIDNVIPAGIANFSSAEGVTTSAPTLATLNYGPLQVLVNKNFNPLTVSGGSTSLLTVTLTNNSAVNYIGVNFTDNMPTGMQLAAPLNVSTTCASGIITGNPGDGSFRLSGASMPSNSSCTVSVRVVSSAEGNLTNTIPVAGVRSFQGATNPDQAQATLTNLPGIGLGKSFTPSTVNPGDITRLTITIINSRPVDLSNLGITDTLPAGLAIASPPNTSTNCPAGVVTTTANSVTLGSATVVSSTTCSFSVDVLVAAVGSYTNIIPAGSITSTQSFTNPDPVEATVTAAILPTIAKSFAPNTISQGDISTLTIQLGNASGAAITLTSAFVDNLPTNVLVAPTPNIGGTCTTANVVANAGTITYNNGATIPNGGCRITVQVTSATNGVYVNTIPANALQTNIGNNPIPATATLTVQGGSPNVVLVKRITRINTNDLNGYENDLSTTNDDITNNWPNPLSDSLRGSLAQTNVRPQDEVEYTIYYLNIGLNNANNVRICDPVPANTLYIANAFNGSTPTDGGLPADLGIVLQTGTTIGDRRYLTGINDGDRGRYYDPTIGEVTPSTGSDRCVQPDNPTLPITTNPNGIVTVNVTRIPTFPSVPNATGAGLPPSSYGFVRFKVRVK